MKEKIIKIIKVLYKIAIVISIAVVYNFLFSDFFDIYNPGWYVVCATFLTVVYLREETKIFVK